MGVYNVLNFDRLKLFLTRKSVIIARYKVSNNVFNCVFCFFQFSAVFDVKTTSSVGLVCVSNWNIVFF